MPTLNNHLDSHAKPTHAPGCPAVAALVLCLLLAVGASAQTAPAATQPAATQPAGVEIHSNGRGGGPWSDPDTWHGGRVPGPGDIAVIAMRDQVTFDRDDRDQPTCRELYLDPDAVLNFDSGRDRRTLSVVGPIESYGTIRIDATADRRALDELRLVGTQPSQRIIRLRPHAALLLYGHESQGAPDPNVLLTALTPDAQDAEPARLIANGKVMLDLQRTRVQDLALDLSHLDNTGARAEERLNLIANAFTGRSSLSLTSCDTPLLRDNTFHTDAKTAPDTALRAENCALAQIQGNQFQGPYGTAIFLTGDNNSSISNTRITGATNGIFLGGENIALSSAAIEAAQRGVQLYHARAVLHDVHVRRSALAYRIERSTAQIVDSTATEPIAPKPPAGKPPAPVSLHVEWWSTLLLINTPIDPAQITCAGGTLNNQPFVQTMQYLVARVSPKPGASLPPGLRVQVETAARSGGVPKGRADLNVRNAPATLSPDGLTPLPPSRQAITVQSWSLDPKGKLQPAPAYTLKVQAPEGKDTYKTLLEKQIHPDDQWYRPDPDNADPTLEVTLP